jgi:pyruvate formate-lyase activating enzyme-like uncharacterized protein
MYDYGYSGGLPVAGSEELCLELMLWGIDHDVPFGMHYCSLDNKHRSEMRQRNERGKSLHPVFRFDEGDYFLKCAKVFGDDVNPTLETLLRAGKTDMLQNEEARSLSFPRRYLRYLGNLDISPAISICVLEDDEEGAYLREVALKPVR